MRCQGKEGACFTEDTDGLDLCCGLNRRKKSDRQFTANSKAAWIIPTPTPTKENERALEKSFVTHSSWIQINGSSDLQLNGVRWQVCGEMDNDPVCRPEGVDCKVSELHWT